MQTNSTQKLHKFHKCQETSWSNARDDQRKRNAGGTVPMASRLPQGIMNEVEAPQG